METKSLLFLLLAGGLCSAHLVASMITYRKTRSWHDMRMNVFKTVFFLKLAVVLFYGVSNRENIYLAWSTDVLLGLACLYFLCVAVSGLQENTFVVYCAKRCERCALRYRSVSDGRPSRGYAGR